MARTRITKTPAPRRPKLEALMRDAAGNKVPTPSEWFDKDAPTYSAWQPIETAPCGEELLLAAKYGPSHLTWRYGVGSYSQWNESKMLWDWRWTFAPQFWKRISPPTGDSN